MVINKDGVALTHSTRYYFGRLNVIASYDDKTAFVRQGLNIDRFIGNKGYDYGFFEVDQIQSGDESFFHGYLVKYAPETDAEVAVLETRRLEDTSINNRVVAKSRFFLHVRSGLIAYHPVSSQINRDAFRSRFRALFEESHGNLLVRAEIQLIQDQYQVLAELDNFEFITKVSVYLHPSNPSTRELWKNVDERLQKLGATNYHEQIEGKIEKEGLKVKGDEELAAKISMAEDGYGKAEVTGLMDGQRKTITTQDNPVTTTVPDGEIPPENVLDSLLPTIRNLFSRFRQ
ncbi:MAG TPA: hypothetical protein VF600_08505 [Abditibacteriaceae bacterium]|jgi:hypothetical protein